MTGFVVILAAVLVWWGRLHLGFEDLRRKMGVSSPAMAVLVAAGVGGPILAALAGTLPPWGAGRLSFVLAVVLYGIGVVFVGIATGMWSRFRFVRAASPDETGSTLDPGDVVRLEGETTPAGDILRAPATGDRCLAYTCTTERARWMFPRRVWATVDVDRGATTFTLDDGSGPVTVDPADARLELRFGDLVVDDGSGERREPLRYEEPTAPRPESGDRRRSREFRLDPEESATVVGTVVDDGPDGLGPAVAAAGGPMLVSDRDLDGLVRDVRLTVLVGGPAGLLASLAGLWWLFAVTGAV